MEIRQSSLSIGWSGWNQEKNKIRGWAFILNSHWALLSKGKESGSLGLGYRAFHHKVTASNLIPTQGITESLYSES